MKRLIAGIAAVLSVGAAAAVLELPKIFSSHMVLQRETAVPVFGRAASGVEVEVSFAGVRQRTLADDGGRWEVVLPPLKACVDGRPLTVIAGAERLTLDDVAVGDVWLCSGQSNMEYSFGWHPLGEERFAAEAKALPQIRTVRIVRGDAMFPDAELGYHDLFTAAPGWHPAGEQFELTTCVGWFFARRIAQETGLAIGLINASWSASRIEPFIPPAAFAGEPELSALAAKVEAALPNTAAGRAAVEDYCVRLTQWGETAAAAIAAGCTPPPRPRYERLDTLGLGSHYNHMIHPLTRFPVKGVLWYQGCANSRDGSGYLPLYRALVNGWRHAWRQPELPFYSVQLAAFWNNWRRVDAVEGGDGFTLVREAQLKGMAIEHTGMAVALDLGEPWEIHPREKYHVGERLARWALHNEYGRRELTVSGPIYRSARVVGSEMRIAFDSVGKGLMIGVKRVTDLDDPAPAEAGTALKGFAIAGADRRWYRAEARIEGAEVVVSAREVASPVAVRYAFTGAPEANLYNRDGLPASPFRTDDWDCPLARQ